MYAFWFVRIRACWHHQQCTKGHVVPHPAVEKISIMGQRFPLILRERVLFGKAQQVVFDALSMVLRAT
jgi:hypothetical protein